MRKLWIWIPESKGFDAKKTRGWSKLLSFYTYVTVSQEIWILLTKIVLLTTLGVIMHRVC